MKLAPIPEDPGFLYQTAFAPAKAEILLAAIKVGLFKHLEQPVTADELAGAQGWDPKATGILLHGLAACDLLVKRGGAFRNIPETSRFLVPGKPTYLGDHMVGMHGMVTNGLSELPDRLRNGPPAETNGPDQAAETDWSALADGMANSARSGRAQMSARLIRELPEFPSFTKMLDLGGGPGIHCIAMVQEHPSLQGVVFDRPAMREKALHYIQEYGLADRITFRGGEYMSDSIGSGYDLVWACSSLNFSGPRLDELVAKVHDALVPGGVFAAFQEGLTQERTKPEEMVMHMLAWRLGADQGTIFEQGQIAEAMLRAGFRSVRSKTVHTYFGDMDLDVARK